MTTQTSIPPWPGGCDGCRAAARIPDITMAFQPIVDTRDGSVFAYEALVRGADGAPAGAVLDAIDEDGAYTFDQRCRVRAIEQAAALGIETRLSINFLPNAIYDPETCIRATVAAATRTGFPLDALMFEMTEVEAVRDAGRLREIVQHYRSRGFLTAIDDFGSGYAGLGLVAEFLPDVIKIDMGLLRGLHHDRRRYALVSALAGLCEELGVTAVGEGVQERGEAEALCELGVHLQQGYLYARPALDALPELEPDAAAPT